ncbi:peptidase M50 [Geomonas sp. Red69]|uniref:peptidase M50 n=1 Tax=Geomonas diazotrophica TaxID=2843197 RepID=UPI001C0F43D0|nr:MULTISPECIES: peptidase M50 [Geomonas]MBU5635342.1 peptidase M50 [Geomonas diazotrophica]QXE86743.1 peptidase M50 [Geomonas nitrogeniifigens]
MTQQLFSSSWYRICRLQPRLRRHAQLHRHEYRGEVWFVLQNHVTGQLYRFSPVVYHVIGLMDGKRSVEDLWKFSVDSFGDDAPTQDDLLRLLAQLHSADVLLCDIQPDTRELFQRGENLRQGKLRQTLLSPLSWRFPIFDPDRLLNLLQPLSRAIFSPVSGVIWLAVVLAGAALAFGHRAELSHDVLDRVLSMHNIALLWAVYPLVKFCHEIGHALAVKRWGGEVHEVGIMLLVLIPVPYVDASAASAFPQRGRRAMVSAAGIMAELFIASLALMLWLCVEPGLLRSALFNAMFIGGVSTIFFNGNPLLRYDGYYILSDLLAIPNLGQRGQRYAAYLVQHHLFGLKKLEAPHLAPGEPFWLLAYFGTSFVYRIFVYLGIVLFISQKFFFIGVILGGWALVSMVALPLGKAIYFICFNPALYERRLRAACTAAAPVALLVALFCALPFPCWSRAQGVVWVPEESVLRAGAGGLIRKVSVLPGSVVRRGETLLESDDPELEAERKVLAAQLALLKARRDSELFTDRLKARITAEEMVPVRERIAWVDEQLARLKVVSPVAGKLVLQRDSDLPGRHLQKGEVVGFVLQGDRPTVRVVVTQADLDLIHTRSLSIEVRLSRRLDRSIPATLLRETPAGLERLPSTSLGSAGGGRLPTDPSDRDQVKTFERTFQLDLRLPLALNEVSVNERVYVRFNFQPEPLASQCYRSVRRLFMRRFDV